MGGELRNKVASGVAWSLSEKVGTILLQMVVSIVVARLLMPDDVGVMALMTFFTSLALVVVDSGFSQMLIRKSDPDPCDYKSVFLFNIVVSWVVYLLLVLCYEPLQAPVGQALGQGLYILVGRVHCYLKPLHMVLPLGSALKYVAVFYHMAVEIATLAGLFSH